MNKLMSRRTFPVLLILLLSLPLFGQSSAASDDLVMSTEAVGPVRFVAAHGRRSALMGYGQNGLELWAWPFQILDGYCISFRPEGASSEIRGEQILRRVEYRPDAITRIYAGPDFIVRERLFVPLDRPGAIVTFEVHGRGQVDIDVQFTPQMNLMWPAAVGGQGVQWNSSLSGYVLTDSTDGYTAAIASSDTVAHDAAGNSAVRSGDSLAMLLHPKAVGPETAVAHLFAGMNAAHSKDPGEIVTDLASNQQRYEQEAREHYAKLESASLEIRTPDEDVNRALAWSVIALDQAWVCNPQLGCGIVGGYGPSRRERRPQYAWFFAGDGLVATDGLVDSGDYARARAELEFILKYQNHKTGMIWHELSQSAGFLDWENKYPYMFVHVDITDQFLASVAHYVETSGDVDFARQHWDKLSLAYRYCASIIDSSTHLPRIPADKEGSDEQDRESDELSLSAAWLDASSAFAKLAKWTSHAELAAEAGQASDVARKSIAARYWDSTRQFWISGHSVNGGEIFDEKSGPGDLIGENIFAPQQNDILLSKIASSDFQTDWGARGLSSSSRNFNPDSYATGSVFALGATSLAEAFWNTHRPAIAFSIWSAVVPWTSLDSLGHIHEVLAGDYYHQQTESVPEQTWSSAGLISAATNGLLGLHVDSIANTFTFAPHVPPAWQSLSARNVRVGAATLDLDVERKDGGIDLALNNRGSAIAFTFDPEIPLGAEVLSAKCGERVLHAERELHEEDEHARIQFTAPAGVAKCSIAFRGGVTVIPSAIEPSIGDSSRGLKITGVHLQGGSMIVDADINAAGPQSVEIRTPWKIASVDGGKVSPEGVDIFRIDFDADANPVHEGYSHRSVTIYFGNE